ncbi:MAG TPA: RluA family pseudouridine synthase [Pyrinomonadaceae bacterium]|nr:RluA family pseudouridine synthase [Pyrinomonadaceae bacterium]
MTQELQFRVDEGEAGARLDEFLAARLLALSRMRIAGLLASGACTVNGSAASAGRKLSAGDRVALSAPAGAAPNSMTPEPLPLEVVHEDEHLIVVVKPSGVLVHPTLGVKTGTLANALAYRLNSGAGATPVRPGIVHRLDRETSGLLVVAKTQAALSRLSQHFRRRLVEKRYLAVVGGSVGAEEQVINAPVGREEGARPPWRVLESGKQAETRLRVLERGRGRALVELEPVTGRTNQLRIHCAHAGHAIVGDRWYGGEPHARLCLHAARLAFHHPATNEWAEFSSPLPDEVASALGAIS